MAMIPFSIPRTRQAFRSLALLTVLVGCTVLAACGFRMKGVTPLPFNTLYTNIAENSAFGAALRRAIRAASPNTRIVSTPDEAEVRLLQLNNDQRLRQLSIDADGRVEEYELTLEFVFELVDAAGHIILPPTTLMATRDVPYDDSAVQARQSEITMNFQQMQQSMVDRVMFHITSPDVIDAYRSADTRPIETRPADLRPISNDPMPSGSGYWGTPQVNPLTGIR